MALARGRLGSQGSVAPASALILRPPDPTHVGAVVKSGVMEVLEQARAMARHVEPTVTAVRVCGACERASVPVRASGCVAVWLCG